MSKLNKESFGLIKQECESIDDLVEQIKFLNKKLPILEDIYYKYSINQFNELPKKFKDNIYKYYDLEKNWRIKKYNNHFARLHLMNESLSKENLEIFLRFNFFLDSIRKIEKDVYNNPKFRKDKIKYFPIEFKKVCDFNMPYSDFNKLLPIDQCKNRLRDDLYKAKDLLEVKNIFYLYKEKNKPFEFENCIFDEVDKIKMFSQHLESYKVKLVYLQYASEYIFDEDDMDFIEPEIRRIQNIIDLENTKSKDVLMNPEVNQNFMKNETKEKDVNIEKVQWRGNNTELYYLINELEKEGFLTKIDKNNFKKIIANFFIGKKGKPFYEKNITQGSNNLLDNTDKGKSRNSFKIDKILNKIKENKK